MKYENKIRAREIVLIIDDIEDKLFKISNSKIQIHVSCGGNNTVLVNTTKLVANMNGLNIMLINSIVNQLNSQKSNLLSELEKL